MYHYNNALWNHISCKSHINRKRRLARTSFPGSETLTTLLPNLKGELLIQIAKNEKSMLAQT